MRSIAWKYAIAMILLCSLIMAGAAAENIATGQSQQVVAVAVGGEVIPVPVPTPGSGSDPAKGYTKLEIVPSYTNLNLEPGQSKEMTVTIRNRDTKTAHIRPSVISMPYAGPYTAESSWITITPAQADIPAGESARCTIKASVPEDTPRGSYSTQVAFSDETYPSAYPQPFQNYIHTMSVSINVISSPVVRISTPYINDQLESGRLYTYEVELKNTGKKPVQLDPRISSDSYVSYGPYGVQTPPLDEKSFIIDAPRIIQPGTAGLLTIIVNVPAGGSGYYNGYVDLGIDDPGIRPDEGRIQLNFLVWKQPSGVFTKNFTLSQRDTISVVLTSAMPVMYPPVPADPAWDIPRRDPSFDVSLFGPDGDVGMVLTEKEIKGSVSLGGEPALSSSSGAGQYMETSTQYVFTYTAEGKPGKYSLMVTPRNTQAFEYRISFGETGSSGPSLFQSLSLWPAK
ncbi:MAG: hypothetical protein A4E35_01583 [Methanoregula sp. PtaU1.Bin051]|nr:MAG: hypothetical protein A4E35_01583 [Methanoregula sp. PtaU1.Bin051]